MHRGHLATSFCALAAAHLRSRGCRPRVRFNDRHDHRESTVRASMSRGTSLLAHASQGPLQSISGTYDVAALAWQMMHLWRHAQLFRGCLTVACAGRCSKVAFEQARPVTLLHAFDDRVMPLNQGAFEFSSKPDGAAECSDAGHWVSPY